MTPCMSVYALLCSVRLLYIIIEASICVLFVIFFQLIKFIYSYSFCCTLFLFIAFIEQVDYFQVFVNHFDVLVEVVAFPLSLAQSLRRAKLVSQQQVDSILNSKEPQDPVNVTRLLKEVRNLLKVSKKHPEQLRTKILILCEVLSDQDCPTLSVIATDILEECGIR